MLNDDRVHKLRRSDFGKLEIARSLHIRRSAVGRAVAGLPKQK
jgi:hypothetical protein